MGVAVFSPHRIKCHAVCVLHLPSSPVPPIAPLRRFSKRTWLQTSFSLVSSMSVVGDLLYRRSWMVWKLISGYSWSPYPTTGCGRLTPVVWRHRSPRFDFDPHAFPREPLNF